MFNLPQGRLCLYIDTTENLVTVSYNFTLALLGSISFDGDPSGQAV
jgi:hypothetical protein